MSESTQETSEPVTIRISGMSCGHCVSAVRKALEAVPGVSVRAVEIGSASVVLDGARATLADAEAAIDAAGYDVVKGRVLNVSAAPSMPTPRDA
jgi:copper chaperone CopZ